jgi:hypothetical protein
VRTAARLVMSELVTNAITHAGTDVGIATSFTGKFLRIAVQDGCTTLPRSVPDDPHTPTMRRHGLQVVRDTAHHWGVTPLPDGKIVWALFRGVLEPGRPVAKIRPSEFL